MQVYTFIVFPVSQIVNRGFYLRAYGIIDMFFYSYEYYRFRQYINSGESNKRVKNSTNNCCFYHDFLFYGLRLFGRRVYISFVTILLELKDNCIRRDGI